MDEDQYRNTYRRINETRCWFEKGINSRRCTCALMERFNLADREGVRCTDAGAQQVCADYLRTVREKAVFTLQLTKVDGPLPHAKEARVQVGSMLGLLRLQAGEKSLQQDAVPDIHTLLQWGMSEYGSLEALPYPQLVQAIAQVQTRSRRKR
jgi:hypothetical protein